MPIDRYGAIPFQWDLVGVVAADRSTNRDAWRDTETVADGLVAPIGPRVRRALWRTCVRVILLSGHTEAAMFAVIPTDGRSRHRG